MANSLDLGQIYGLGNCPMGGCESMHMNNSKMPTLEQIAPYSISDGTSSTTAAISSQTEQMEEFPNAQPAANGVSNAVSMPMTQNQINAENPEMLTSIETYGQPFPVTADSIQYLNSLMRTQIGRRVTVELMIGSGSLIEKSGFLLAVGANFILLNEIGTKNVLSCDFYAIKFVTFYYQ